MRDTTLNVFCSNVRGIVCNWQNAKSFNWGEFDIVAFNEVWEVKSFENLAIEGFKVVTSRLRQNGRGGGSLIFAKIDCNVIEITTPFIEGHLESTGIKIGDITFLNIYRPPRGDKDLFVESITNFIGTLNGGKIIIGGDFNLNAMPSNQYIDAICNLFQLQPKIRGITRIESGTCIDNFLTNIPGIFGISDIQIADHLAITAKIECVGHNKLKKEKYFYRDMREYNWVLFNHQVHGLKVRGDNIESKWTNLLDDIKNAVDLSFPIKESNKNYVFKMSDSLKKCKNKKNKLLKQYKRGVIAKEVYTNYNRIYRKLIKSEQCKIFKEKLVHAGSNGKMKWKAIKAGLLLESEKSKIAKIEINGRLITQDKEIATSFKNHFETCALKLADGLPKGEDTSVIMEQGECWGFEHISEIGIVEIIRSLINKNSSGYDSLSNKMLKREAYAFAKLIKPIINESIDMGIFPECLKTAKLLPVFKKGNTMNMDNYRPISLLPVLSKVFEKVLNNKLTSIIENKYIDENQFGFRKNHSTEDAVLRFVDKLERDIAMGKHVVSIYIDVSKAFDSCDHEIILKKLKRTGLDEIGLKLMSSYLKNRKQIVIVNEIDGGYYLINIGVGQGTILGPTLFKVYIMDMHLYTDLFCVKFADDSSFECSSSSRDTLEEIANIELKKVAEWFKKNRLTLHPDKSRFIIHSRDKLIDLKLDGKKIMRCGYGLQEESVKLLGLHIDENLDWKVHVSNLQKKIGKGNYLLWRHKKKLNLETKKLIYESFVRCHLLYCLTLWGGAKSSVLAPLNKMINRILKKIGQFKQHSLNRLHSLKILKLEHELEVQECKIIWKWDKKKAPTSLRALITEKQNRLRGRQFFIYRNAKTNSISTRLAKRATNKIGEIARYNTVKTLSKHIKNQIIAEKYTFNCTQRQCYICGR